jgi:hypothetical protein
MRSGGLRTPISGASKKLDKICVRVFESRKYIMKEALSITHQDFFVYYF